MKKVIVTVGTSIFTNCLKERTDIRPDFDYIQEKRHREWESCRKRADRIRKPVTEWVNHAGSEASAEIKSLLKLHRMEKDHLDVYLLATDTVASRLAAEIIKDVFDRDVFGIGQEVKVYFNEQYDVIGGLQIEHYQEFVKTGVHQFVRRINQLVGNYFPDTVFNISGGYKGLIPFMTIMAQVNNCDVVYIYEDSDTLIKIPKAPITVDEGFIEKYYNELVLLDQGIEQYGDIKRTNFQAFEELEQRGMVESLGDWAFLSPIGKIFLENYRNQYFVFYCSDEVWNDIQRQPDIQRILSEKFHNRELRESKTEIKQELPDSKHTVYDDGNNNNRIYFLVEDGKIYIYKTFEDEEAARKFIRTDLDKDEIIRISKFRRWGNKHV